MFERIRCSYDDALYKSTYTLLTYLLSAIQSTPVRTGAHSHLFDDVDAVVELLALQHRMQVRQEDVEMLATVAVGHDDGDAVAGGTAAGSADTARHQRRVLADDVRLGIVVLVVDVDEHPTSCVHSTTSYITLYYITPTSLIFSGTSTSCDFRKEYSFDWPYSFSAAVTTWRRSISRNT